MELERIEIDSKLGPVIFVRGADILDGTPILDIKPYLPYSEAKTEARGGFADKVKDDLMDVIFGAETVDSVPKEDLENIEKLLSQDPRPHYQDDPERVYGMAYKDWEVKFRAEYGTIYVHKIHRI